MKLKNLLFYSLFVVFFTLLGCQSSFKYNFEKNENTVRVYMDSLVIQLEVVDDAIIHVTKKLTTSTLANIPDYVTVLKPQTVEWTLSESSEALSISTAQVIVTLKSDGTISYQSKDGQHLLAETNDLSYITPDSKSGRKVSQAFVAGDEGLYGLGQYQSGIMNWRSVSTRLEQFNQEIAIPFLLSTNNYGIYWHNYSVTDFNASQYEIEFPENEVKAKKTKNEALDQDAENVINHKVKENLDKNIRQTTFTPKQSGQYTFFVESDKGVRMRGDIRVSIDDDTIINYSTIWVPSCFTGIKELEAGKEYTIVFQNTGASIPGTLHYNTPDFNKTVFSSEEGNTIEYYLVHGDNPAAILGEYQKLTGKAPMFPKKSYGFWQCRERYHNQKELLENAHEMRERKIPVDNIVQDWFYWPKDTKGPEWDRVKYPDPKAMAAEVKDLNLNLMVSVWPMVNNTPLLANYDLLQHKLGKGNHNLDFYDAGVRERYYQMLSDSMFHFGVNSIWLDGTEPTGRPSKDEVTADGKFGKVYNIYSLMVTKAMYEGKRKEFPNERVFNLTRSAYAGQQRYGAAAWSGDVAATWEQFAEQISAGLNFTMAGVPYWTHDIGGFFRDANSMNEIYDDQYTNPEFIELMARWFQFGTFSPIFRIHGYVSETEIWHYGQEFEDMARKFIELRYQLMPYIYSEAWKITNESHTLMSPLVYQYPNDQKTWGIKDQLFFGESMMVAFATEYKQRSKDVYLPNGDWFNYWTNEKVTGNRTLQVDAPYDETPIFVKAGSIIPTGPKIQYATQETDEPLRIKIYPGKDAEYVLYLDDNTSYKYEEGIYSELLLSYSEADKTLNIKTKTDNYTRFDNNPINLIIEVIGTDNTNELSFKGKMVSVEF